MIENKYFITFSADRHFFQAVIITKYDLEKEFSKLKTDKEISIFCREFIEEHKVDDLMPEWMREGYPYESTRRILCWQKLPLDK